MNGTLSSASRTRQAGGSGEHRIGAVDQQHLHRRRVGGENVGRPGVQRPPLVGALAAARFRRAGRTGNLRHERHAARFADAAQQRIQRVDGERGEQAVGVRERRAADDGDRRPLVDQLAREALDARRRHAGGPFDVRRRVAGQPAVPAVDERPGAAGGVRRAQARRQSSPARGRAPARPRCRA